MDSGLRIVDGRGHHGRAFLQIRNPKSAFCAGRRSHRLAVRTPASHVGNTGSIPVGTTPLLKDCSARTVNPVDKVDGFSLPAPAFACCTPTPRPGVSFVSAATRVQRYLVRRRDAQARRTVPQRLDADRHPARSNGHSMIIVGRLVANGNQLAVHGRDKGRRSR
jgi:hypothetical protein